ncbi:hypothetical protein ACFL54_09395 [Planctomycetota bacterium]
MSKRMPWKLFNYPVYLAVSATRSTFMAISLPRAQAIGKVLGRVLGVFDYRHRGRIRDHLKIAFPEWNDRKIRKYMWKAYEHLGMLSASG